MNNNHLAKWRKIETSQMGIPLNVLAFGKINNTITEKIDNICIKKHYKSLGKNYTKKTTPERLDLSERNCNRFRL